MLHRFTDDSTCMFSVFCLPPNTHDSRDHQKKYLFYFVCSKVTATAAHIVSTLYTVQRICKRSKYYPEPDVGERFGMAAMAIQRVDEMFLFSASHLK